MSQHAEEALIPLHEYELRHLVEPEEVALYCRRCGLAVAAWTKPPTLDLVIRTAREHERSAHHRAPSPAAHRPGGGP